MAPITWDRWCYVNQIDFLDWVCLLRIRKGGKLHTETREAEVVVHIQKVASQGHGDESGTCSDECHWSFAPIIIPFLVCIPDFKIC